MERKHLKRSLFSILLLGLVAGTVAQQPSVSVKHLMTVSEFNGAGLNKLTPNELSALDKWFVKTLVTFTQRTAATGGSSVAVPGSYPVEASSNDEIFVINGEVFKAKAYCYKVNKGDRVKFVEGSASGACASAKFINIRTGDVCAVWCE